MSWLGENGNDKIITVLLFIVIALASLLLFGCGPGVKPEPVTIVKTVQVKVPVPVARTPPIELSAPYAPDKLPKFVSPADPAATSALTREGEIALKLLIHDLLVRDGSWRAWATEPPAATGDDERSP